MVFFKKVEVKDARAKYGFSHQGIFAAEHIRRNEAIFTCDPDICDYVPLDKVSLAGETKTRAQTVREMQSQPADVASFIHKYIYMVDDDRYDWPRHYVEMKLSEPCMLFNHSCEPNCGFASLDSAAVVAIREIEPGDELTYDYQCMDSEAIFYDGMQCRCQTDKCRGTLRFDQYRNVDWQNAFYRYSGTYIKRRIDELKTKWYSSRCYLKYLPVPLPPSTANVSANANELALVALRTISKDDLVAKFSSKEIAPSEHYLRQANSDAPATCTLRNGNEVFALVDMPAETECTLDYTKM